MNGGSEGTFVVADPGRNAIPMLRTEFTADNKGIAGAGLYVTARGIYEIYLNCSRVGDDYFNPGQTQYNKSHFYQTYDVTSLVKSGENAIGAMLGEGIGRSSVSSPTWFWSRKLRPQSCLLTQILIDVLELVDYRIALSREEICWARHFIQFVP